MINPWFALVMAVLFLPSHLFTARQLSSDSLTPQHRRFLERMVSSRWSIVLPGVATVLLVAEGWFALRSGHELWWLWLTAGLVFAANLVLAARLRRRVVAEGGPGRPGSVRCSYRSVPSP